MLLRTLVAYAVVTVVVAGLVSMLLAWCSVRQPVLVFVIAGVVGFAAAHVSLRHRWHQHPARERD